MEVKSIYLNNTLRFTCEKKGTDIHICIGSKPLMRLNGKLTVLEHMEITTLALIDEIIDSMLEDFKKEKLYRDKVLDFSFSVSEIGRFRANIYSQRGTFAIAIRILPLYIQKFSDLGIPQIVETFVTKTKGLFLVTGSTGSGKSTTLASIIDLINKNNSYHIITIEDPIEYIHNHKKSLVTQREVGEDTPNFENALRSALREDPDVIMVGEMRDAETISIALTAAETGHLVMSTLHTIGASKTIDRIIDAFEPAKQNQVRSQLATVLQGVVSQQLIPRIDETGVVLASEVMVTNPAIVNLIREGKHYQINSAMQIGQSQGMQVLEGDLARLCNLGIIDKDEAILVQDPQLFQQFLNRR